MSAKKRVTVTLPEDIVQAVDLEVERSADASRSAVIERWLRAASTMQGELWNQSGITSSRPAPTERPAAERPAAQRPAEELPIPPLAIEHQSTIPDLADSQLPKRRRKEMKKAVKRAVKRSTRAENSED